MRGSHSQEPQKDIVKRSHSQKNVVSGLQDIISDLTHMLECNKQSLKLLFNGIFGNTIFLLKKIRKMMIVGVEKSLVEKMMIQRILCKNRF